MLKTFSLSVGHRRTWLITMVWGKEKSTMGIRNFNSRRSQIKKKNHSPSLHFVDILFVLGPEAHPTTAKRNYIEKCQGIAAQNFTKSPSKQKYRRVKRERPTRCN